jgi:hypothetical protein
VEHSQTWEDELSRIMMIVAYPNQNWEQAKMMHYETTEWNALSEEQRSAILKKAHETEEVISIDGKIYSSALTFDGVLALHPRLGIDQQDK